MKTAPTACCHLVCVLTAAFAAGCLIAAAVVPERAGADEAEHDAQAGAAAGASSWCSRIPAGYGHPSANLTPLTLQLTQPSVEPVPATDGLVHLAYTAQATNTGARPADILDVVPVDPLAGFSPTGRNLIIDAQGRSLAGKVRLFATSPDDSLPDTDPEPAQSATGFSTRVPAGSAGLMFFDVTYSDQAQVPRLLAHAITLGTPDGGASSAPGLTNPVPVGCKKLAVLHPPLVGHGWLAGGGCCTPLGYHWDEVVVPINGALQAEQQFAIDYIQIGPNNTCCNGPVTVLTSWWGYNTPVLAAAPGVVVEAVDGIPDNDPVGKVTPEPAAGNHVVEDIGGGRYVSYRHLKSGSIPAWVRVGARLRPGVLIGRVGNSGNSQGPHLHFEVTDAPSSYDAAGLPFVFDTQVLEGSVSEADLEGSLRGALVAVDRTGAGVRRGLMPARNGVFGYNLSH